VIEIEIVTGAVSANAIETGSGADHRANETSGMARGGDLARRHASRRRME
jgi:hypothetical protein